MSTSSPQWPFPADLITKAEAARLRGITRQAIHNLVVRGKLPITTVGGREFVSRNDVLAYQPSDESAPSPDDQIINSIIASVKAAPAHLHSAIREALFRVSPHQLEKKLGVSSELILTSVDKAGDITLRGLRGIITEEVFRRYILEPLVSEDPSRWSIPTDYNPNENPSFDAVLVRDGVKARIQVKMQRSERHVALTTDPVGKYGILPGYWVAETQRTRNAKGSALVEAIAADADGQKTVVENTRPYKFTEFDILAVSVHPATGDWNRFLYTLSDWLLPRPKDEHLMRIYQPVPYKPVSGEWTDDLEEAFDWFLANNHNRAKKISGAKTHAAPKSKKGKTKA